MEGELTKQKCQKCGRGFEYMKRWRAKVFCPDCLKANLLESYKKARKHRRLERPGRLIQFHRRGPIADASETVAKMTTGEIARQEGLSAQVVERTIEKALGIIRKSPELKELWAIYKSEGLPTPSASAVDVGEQLLEWQMDLAAWYDLYEAILTPETEAEAAECMAEIANFNSTLDRIIGEISQNRQ